MRVYSLSRRFAMKPIRSGLVLLGLAVIGVLAAWQMVPAQAPPGQPPASTPSSYDQIAPVLLGKEALRP